MRKMLRATLLLTVVYAGPLVAQTAMPGPPPVLWIQRELVKPGKSSAHNDWEDGPRRSQRRTGRRRTSR
jgi:hypothetical protein